MGIKFNYKEDHPERREDEYFVGNLSQQEIDKIKLKSVRIANHAYNAVGELIPRENGKYAVFVNLFERENLPFE